MNKKMLFDLFSVYGGTDWEDEVVEFVENFLKQNNINYTKDKYNNIYNVSYTNKPILCAHMDAVGDKEDSNCAKFIEIIERNNKEYLIGRGNIGADDKCGIFIILSYLTEISREINFIFTTGEEQFRPTGIPFVCDTLKNNEIFKSVPYALVLDRHEGHDILCSQNKYGSNEFEEQLVNIGEKYGYKPAKGTYCDAHILRYFMNSCNLSVGYYNAHTKQEFIDLEELNNAYHYVIKIVETIKEKVPMIKWRKYEYKKHMFYRWLDHNLPNLHKYMKRLYY